MKAIRKLIEELEKRAKEKFTIDVTKLKVLTTAARAELDSMGWISVKDRLPEKNSQVLTLCNLKAETIKKYSPVINQMEYWNDKGWFDWCGDDDEGLDITHWQPLPEPPKE